MTPAHKIYDPKMNVWAVCIYTHKYYNPDLLKLHCYAFTHHTPMAIHALCTRTIFAACMLLYFYTLINPRRACAARVTVVGLCVCLSVCLSVCRRLFSHYTLRGGV